MKRKALTCGWLCLALLTACGGGGGGGKPMLDWVVLAFLDGDGNREWQAATNLAQLEEVDARNSTVRIYAFLDRHPNPTGLGYYSDPIPTVGGTDWSDSRWGPVTYDGNPATYASTLQLYSTTKPEVSVGHPSVLNGFITQAMNLAPAKHYALIIYDHGAPHGIAQDESQNDILSTRELGQVLAAVPLIDVLVLDACDMQHVEVATELIGEVGYVLASQQPRWGKALGSNIYYNRSIDWLVANPGATPEAFARRLLLDDQHGAHPLGNASILRVADVAALNASIDDFADTALTMATPLDWTVLGGLNTSARSYFAGVYRDLREYMDAVASHPALPIPLRDAAQKVHGLLDPITGSVVVAKEGTGSGLSIIVPPTAAAIPGWYTSSLFEFLDAQSSIGTAWLEYLRKLPTTPEPWVSHFLDGLLDVLPDGPPEAPVIGPEGTVSWIDSRLEDPMDIDFVKIEVASGGDVQPVLYAEVAGGAADGAMPVLTVYGPDGTTMLAQGTADVRGMARVESVLLAGGTHYLAVSAGPAPAEDAGLGDAGTGAYTLRCLFGDPSLVAPRLQLSTAALDFGTVEVGSWGTAALSFSNTGGSTLRIEGLQLPADSFFLAPYEQLALPISIAPGDVARIRVGVRPEGAGPLDATLQILSSDPLAPETAVELRADGG